MQSIEYTVAVADIVAFNDHHHRTSPHTRRMIRTLQMVVGLAIVGMGVWPLFQGAPALTFGPLLAVGVAFVIAMPALFAWSVRRSARRQLAEGHNRSVLGPRKLEIGDDALVEISEQGQQQTRWSAVERVVVTDEHVFIYLSATAGHTVPRGAFATAEQMHAFVGAVRSQVEAQR